MLDAALVLVGGVLLMLPGVVTDVIGLVCLVPFTRALPRGIVRRMVGEQPGVVVRHRPGSPTIIPGEVVDEQSPQDPPRDEPGPALEGRVL